MMAANCYQSCCCCCCSASLGALLLVLVTTCCSNAAAAAAAVTDVECPEAIFSFGASTSDTGSIEAAFPFRVAPQTNPPYGDTFFGRPANRYSDGRLIVDFFAQAFEFPFLSPYLQSVGSDFTRGVNFASSGATASNSSVASPFYFEVQTEQFRYFKERTLAVWNAGEEGGSRGSLQTLLTKPEYFEKGLYIVGLGINDFLVPLIGRIESIEQVQADAPHATANAILSGVKSLYQQGARNIMVLNVPPAGCYPVSVQMLGPWNASALDSDGCLTALNSAIQASNALLKAGLDDLRARTADASIILADLYSIVKTLITNGSQFGFKEINKACCGTGIVGTCGKDIVVNGQLMAGSSCTNPSEYVHWDAVHLTDAANRIIVQYFLTGQYVQPYYALSSMCNLSFKHFTT